MTLYEKIIALYPALEGQRAFADGTIVLRNDSDGSGDYIHSWRHLTFPRPGVEALAALDAKG